MNDAEALNFGLPQHLEHDERYDRADEFVELAQALWDSWDDDALVLDADAGIYADPERVRYVAHEGRWFRSRGPLNIPRPPQGRPVVIQAGSSGRGKQFAARWAEVVFTIQQTPSLMKRFTDDLRAAVVAAGRAPDACKILTAIMPFVGATTAEAEEARDAHNARIHPLVGLSTLASHANLDLSGRPLDEPIAEAGSRGTQGLFEAVLRTTKEQHLTLAEIGGLYGRSVLVPQMVGTGVEVADQLEAIVKDGAADGFVVSPAYLPDSLESFVDAVVPELQRRGVFRKDYAGETLRDHLGIARPKRT
jgi:FMN-dependent oxidoreductase (nitrilotriacetate monooxygenase family)